ncbi:MAG TPA: class I SAM-dependent methyltransferase [Nocardioides sp.]|nr:class I SAM-dependent methyltransferase [Nocardioides sp.]
MIDLEQARRRAKERLRQQRRTSPGVKLTAVQHTLACELGYAGWPALGRDTERFAPVDEPDAVVWQGVRRVSVACLVRDPDAPGGAVLVLHRREGRWVVPSGAPADGEDVWDDAVLRIPMETMGFRRQETHTFALDGDRRHVVFWVLGGRYAGTRMDAAEVEWWTGPVADGAALLREQGDGALASLVEGADESRRSMTYERRAADVHRTLTGVYLSATTAQGGSGFGGTDEEWRDARGKLVEALDPARLSVRLLDQACANGHLAISMVGWASEIGIELTPYGVDIAPELVDRARADHPSLASHFFVGDALRWMHPEGERFEVVHLLLDVVPPELHAALIQHQLDHVVAPGGRLVMSEYGDPPTARSAEALVTRAGFDVAGRTRQPTRNGRPRGCPSVWIDVSRDERG